MMARGRARGHHYKHFPQKVLGDNSE
jgi:hypothetical protein